MSSSDEAVATPPPAPARPWHRGWLMGLVTYGLVAVAVAGILARFWRSHHTLALAIIAFSPFFTLAAMAALVIALRRRRWTSALVAAAVAAVGVGTQIPHFLSDDAPADAARLRVMTLNLRLGAADASEVVRHVRDNNIDLLMLEELNTAGLAKLTAAGLEKELPYNQNQPDWIGPAGAGVWSRYTIQQRALIPGLAFATPAVLVAVPTVKQPVYALAMHPAGPQQASRAWARDIKAVPFILRTVPQGVVIVGGDFNATPDNIWFRDILKTPGYANAIDQAGSGPIRTYNAQHPVPLIAIDHVLTRGAVATDVRSVHISGSDHRGIIATVAIPRTAPDAGR